MENDENKKSKAKILLATGAMWMMIFLGIGGCIRLANDNGSGTPLINIKLAD